MSLVTPCPLAPSRNNPEYPGYSRKWQWISYLLDVGFVALCGIIRPTHMTYEWVIPIVCITAKLLSGAPSRSNATAIGATATKEKSAMRRVRNSVSFILLACLASTWSSVLSAQTLYRCGKTFQDRPCDGADGQIVGVNKSQNSQPSKPSSRAATQACVVKGDQAKELRWQKEAGKTESQQIQEGRYSAEFVRYVYSKPGSAVEVKASVESDCMDQLERDAQAAELQRAADRLRGGGNSPAASSVPAGSLPHERTSPNPTPAPRAPTAEIGGRPSPGTVDNSRCRSLSGREQDIRNQQRAGGSAHTMDRLNSELRSILDQKSSNGC